MIKTHRDRVRFSPGRKGAAGDAAHRLGFLTPSGDKRTRPVGRLAEALGRRSARLAMRCIAATGAPSREPRQAVSMGLYHCSLVLRGIVEEDRASEFVNHRPPTAGELHDPGFLGRAEEETPNGDEPDQDGSKPAESVPAGDEAERELNDLDDRAQLLLAKWRGFTNFGIVSCVYALPFLLRGSDRLPPQSARLQHQIGEFLSAYQGRFRQLRDAISELGDIGREKAYRHVVSVASAFALVAQLAIALFGSALEYLIETTVGDTRLKKAGVYLGYESQDTLELTKPAPSVDPSLPIRLTPMTATCRVPPLSRVKLGIGWSRGVARDAEQ